MGKNKNNVKKCKNSEKSGKQGGRTDERSKKNAKGGKVFEIQV